MHLILFFILIALYTFLYVLAHNIIHVEVVILCYDLGDNTLGNIMQDHTPVSAILICC